MAWKGEVPLLGFEGEYHVGWEGNGGDHSVLQIPVRNYGVISVYAWHSRQIQGEGYNVFFPNDICPIKTNPMQARCALTAKLLVQDFFNRLDHFTTHGEIT